MTELPWGLSQIRELVRFKHAQRTTKRRARRLLDRGRLAEYLDRPCPYCGILMTDWNGRNDWRAPGRDHKIPRSRGGRNAFENIDSRRCNQNNWKCKLANSRISASLRRDLDANAHKAKAPGLQTQAIILN